MLWKRNAVEAIPRIKEAKQSIEEPKTKIIETNTKSQIENLELLKKYKEII